MRIWHRILLVIGFLGASVALADTDPAHLAKRAAQQLNAASLALRSADQGNDRVAALTQTIKAYEAGLVAMREGIRRAAISEQVMQLEFESKREELSRLLGVLQSMEASSSPLLLLHPSGPIGTARSGMILSEVTPAIQAQAETLRGQLEEVALLRGLQESSALILTEGLQGAQKARTQLSQAISDRVDLPKRFTEDPVKTAILLDSSETLEGFASGLSNIAEDTELQIDLPDFEAAKGTLPLPVNGTLLRGFKEADASGIRRPGVLLATRPQSIVTTPWPATVRYLGPLLEYGNVMILEPSSGYLLVLAGLDSVYGKIGEVLPAGAPVGLMGGDAPENGDFLSLSGQQSGFDRSQTLYIELRHGKNTVDPEQWFAPKPD